MQVFFKRVGVLQWMPDSLKLGMLDLLHAIIPVVKSAQTHFNVGENSHYAKFEVVKSLFSQKHDIKIPLA